MDVTKPLPLGFFLQANSSPTDAVQEVWVSYKHEKLGEFCYDCVRLGHDNTLCKFVSREAGQHSGYRPELWTGRAPKLDMSPEQLKQWVDEAEERVHTLTARRANAPTDGVGPSPTPPASTIGVPVVPAVHAVYESPPRLNVEQTGGRSGGRGPGGSTVASTLFEGGGVVPLVCLDTFTPGKASSAKEIVRQTQPKPQLVADGGLGHQYFVTEPIEQLSPLVEAQLFVGQSGPNSDIGIEELSPCSSPTKDNIITGLVDRCMSSIFQDLSLKRKAPEVHLDTSRPQKLLKSLAVTDSRV